MYFCIFTNINNNNYKALKTKRLSSILLLGAMLFLNGQAKSQVVFAPVFTQTRLEARADFDYFHINQDDVLDDPLGFHGKYFNFVVGGDLNDKFSYFFRQRIIAHPGSVSFFDNTDFLYLTYHPNKNWMFRLGKDALAVGGFEYDAAPIDVLFSTNYWNNFYCFQLGAAAAYKSDDGNHMLLAQVANSPYVYYGAGADYMNGIDPGKEWRMGLMAYSLYWSGKFGHFSTLYSVNMFERPDHGYMNYIALGNKLTYNRWDLYIDLIHHALASDDWGKNFAAVGCLNFHLTDDFNLYAKGAYEQNLSEADFASVLPYDLDILIGQGNKFLFYGVGFEYNPSFCKDVRLHGVLSYCDHTLEDAAGNTTSFTHTLTANIGITWHMNIHRMFMERGLKKN